MVITSKQLHTFKKNQFFSYVAGMIDGDGSIMICFHRKKNYYYPMVEITLENKFLIDLLHNRFGGNKSLKGNYYKVFWRDQQALNLLMKIRKYLILKSDRANYAINLQLLKNVKGNNKRDERRDKKKKKLYDLMKKLNHTKVDISNKKMSIGNFYCYFAGIIDSEGCITIKKTEGGYGCAELKISTTDKCIQTFIKQRIGFGSYRERKNRKEYICSWQCKQFLKIIRKVKKFLIIKKEQADIAEEFQNRKNGKIMTAKELEYRINLSQKLKDMKRAA